MDIINKIVEAFMKVLYYLPQQAGTIANDNVDLGLGLTPDQMADAFAGCEVVGTLLATYLVCRCCRSSYSTAPTEAKPEE